MTRKQFTLLFIRNDAHVRRFGLSTAGIVLLTMTAFVVIAAALLGSYAGYVFWDRYRDLQTVHSTVRQQLDTQEEKLQRLLNLEAFMRSLEPERLETILDPANDNNSSADIFLDGEEEHAVSTPKLTLSRVELKQSGKGRLALKVEISNRSAALAEGVLDIKLVMKNGRTIGMGSDQLTGETSFSTETGKLLQVVFPGPDHPRTEISALLLTVRGLDGEILSRRSFPIHTILK
jgi:hypothetical protein